ncbi:MAG: hypothetical protein ACREOB_07835 [Thermodesulfobacteriota bacterium]
MRYGTCDICGNQGFLTEVKGHPVGDYSECHICSKSDEQIPTAFVIHTIPGNIVAEGMIFSDGSTIVWWEEEEKQEQWINTFEELNELVNERGYRLSLL